MKCKFCDKDFNIEPEKFNPINVLLVNQIYTNHLLEHMITFSPKYVSLENIPSGVK